jgi:hypothetical protein
MKVSPFEAERDNESRKSGGRIVKLNLTGETEIHFLAMKVPRQCPFVLPENVG